MNVRGGCWKFLSVMGAIAVFCSFSHALAQNSCALIWTYDINDHPEWCEAFKKAGFTALTATLPQETRNENWWHDPASLASTDALLAEANRTQLDVYYQVPLGMMIGTKFGPRTVTAAGFEEPSLPCPLNKVFWSDYLIPAVSAIARKSLEYPAVKGVILDTEQYYGKERSGAINEHYCFCDECFGEFLKTNVINDPPPARSGRSLWLKGHNWEEKYRKHLEERMTKQTAEMASTVRAIAPGFQINFYIFEDAWYYRGLLRGMTPSGLPVLVFDAKTYDGYLNEWAEEAVELTRKLNPQAVWVPGFYTGTLNPRATRANIRKAMETVGSYWIYNQFVPIPTGYLEEQFKPKVNSRE